MGAADWKSIRDRLGVTQIELARLLGVHPQTVSKWERDVALPNDYQRSLLARLALVKKKLCGDPLRTWLRQYDPAVILTTKLWPR